LTAAILATDIAAAGTPSITVFTPAPGGGTSAARPLTVARVNPTPNISSLSPASVTAGSGAFTLTATGAGFAAGATATVGGQARTVIVDSTTQVRIALLATDVVTQGAVAVQVANPASCTNGVGTSNSGNLSVTAPRTATPPPPSPQTTTAPTLTVSSTTAAPGGPVTVTLTNGLGGISDWVALSASSSPDTSIFPTWWYVGAGITTGTWTVSMPSTAGQYEFRLYLNNGSERAATSPTITVGTPPPTTTTSTTTTSSPGDPTVTSPPATTTSSPADPAVNPT